MLLDRFLSSGKVLLRISFLIADLVDRNHVDGRFGLRVESLNGSAADRDAGQH